MHLAGGAEFPTPDGGLLRAANIAPNQETGIGNWTEETFVQRFEMQHHAAVAPGDPNLIYAMEYVWRHEGRRPEGRLKVTHICKAD